MQYTSALLISRSAGIFTIALGFIVLCGWALDINMLKSVLPGLTTMKPNTAVGFMLTGISLSMLTIAPGKGIAKWISQMPAWLVISFGILTFVQYIFDLNLAIDNLLFQVPPGASYSSQHPARMAPQTALLFSIFSGSILLLGKRQTQAIVQYAVLAISAVPVLTMLGYLFGIQTLPLIGAYKPAAIHTTVGFLLLSAGILATTAETGVFARWRYKLPNIAFGLALALLSLAVAATILNSRRAAESGNRHIKLYEVLWRLEKVAAEAEQSIAANRGFVITGHETFITSLEHSRIRLHGNLAEIRNLTTDPEQLKQLSVLESLIAVRNRIGDDIIRLRQEKGLREAADLLGQGEGERINRQIRTKMDAIILAEKNSLAQIENQARTDENHALIALSFALLTGLCLIGFGLVSLKMQIRQHKLTEAERNRLIAILESTTDFVSTADLQANITYINRAGRAMLALGDRPVSELAIADLHPAWALEIISGQGIPAAKLQGSWQGETALLTSAGREIPVSQVILANRDARGEINFLSTVMRDISDLKTAQKALAESEQRYRLLSEYAPEAIMVLDVDKKCFVDANSNTLQLFGVSREQLPHCTPVTLSPPRQADGRLSAEAAEDKIREALAGGAPVFEWIHLNAAGREIPCEIRLLRMPKEGRSLIRGSVTDISNRKNAENALRIRDNALKTSLNAVAMADAYGHLTYVNDSFLALWGYADAGEVLGKPATILWQAPALAQEIMTAMVNTRQPWRGQLTGLKKSGELFEVEISGNIAYDKDGKPIALIASFLDISERCRLEELQRQMLQRFDTLANASPALIWTSGLDKQCDWFNRCWLEFTGRTIEQEKGSGWTEGVHPQDLEHCLSTYISAFDARQPFAMEYRLRRHDGKYRWLFDQGLPRHDANGDFLGYIGSCMDITEEKNVRDELNISEQRLRLALRAANQGMFDLDLESGKAIVSPEYPLMLGYDPDNFSETYTTWFERLHPDDRERVGQTYHSYIAGELREYKVEFRLRMRSGEWKWILSQGSVVEYTPDGQPLRMLGTHTDIDMRKLAEQKLQEREAFYRGVIEASPDSFWLVDTYGRLLQVSDSYCRRSGYSQNELLAMSIMDLDANMPSSEIVERIQLLKQEKHAVFESRHRAKDGSTWPVEVSTVFLPVAGGRFFSFIRDISERKRAENNLRQLYDLQSKIASRLPGVIYQYKLRPDGSSCFPYASEAIRDIYRVTPESVAEDASSVLAVLHPDDFQGIIDSIRISAETLEPWQHEYRVRYADGTERWLFGNSLPEREADGSVVWFGFITDITERKRLENQLRASEASLKEAQRLAQIGSWELDLINNKLDWSEEIFRIFELDPAQFSASYEAFLETVHPEDRSLVNTAYLDSVKNHGNYNIIHRLQTTDGRIKYVHERGETFYRQDQAIRSIGTVQDITQAKLAEQELLLYRNHLETLVTKRTAELEAVNQELEAFAYSVSHDLRAPLRGIDGFSQALLEDYGDKLDGTGRNYLERVRGASQRMGILIDDLLKLSRITRAILKHAPVDLSSLADTVLRQLREANPEHQVETRIEPGMRVNGDPGLLKIALENLLGNAWKYSAKQANPRIECGSLAQNGETVYYIGDNGAGFDMHYADKLFRPFQRLHHRDQFEGTGIGLATVKRIIHRHGGRIWAESEVDQKTTFYFTLAREELTDDNQQPRREA
ncbi:MAG: PAS domain S-box protein [Methylomonas sp.]|nr:PAS domain S-box protein [Methylomonas sp.]